MPLVASALLTLLLHQTSPRFKVRNEDAAVIGAAMRQFFTPQKEEWQDSGWRSGTIVVVATQLGSRIRPAVEVLVGEWAKDLVRYENDPKYGAEMKKDLQPMRALLTELKAVSGQFVPPPIVPLATLDLGPKVVVGDPKSDRFSYWPDAKLPALKGAKLRVIARVSAPGYSADGRIAAVTINAPWSIHSADLLMVFRREGDGWKRLFVRSRFYV